MLPIIYCDKHLGREMNYRELIQYSATSALEGQRRFMYPVQHKQCSGVELQSGGRQETFTKCLQNVCKMQP